jgi:hypothetical protein
MNYNKKYNKKKILEEIKSSMKKSFSLEDLLFEIGFDMKDINKFYVAHVKHRIRYKEH